MTLRTRGPLGAAVLLLCAACDSGSSTGPAPIEFDPPSPPSGEGFVALYAPPVDVGPYPNDIYNLPGETLSVPEKITSPLAAALNTLDGFSTTAKITAPFNAPLDADSLVPFDPLAPVGSATIFVLDATHGVPLVPGADYEVQIADTLGTNGTVLELVPRVPLAPDTTYAFILTDGITSTTGVAAGADQVFRIVRDAHLGGVMTGNVDLDALLPAIGPLIDAGINLLGVDGGDIVSAWSVSTQSISDVLDAIDATATAQASALVPAGMSTADLGLGLPGIADIYVGFLEVPYYGDPENPLESFWVNASLVPPTRDDPAPIPQGGLQRIPMLATLPNAQSGFSEPANGWPLVIVQHGVTVNRTIMLAMADAFAQAGIAVVAIDLPLHGVTDINNPFYHAPGNPFGTTERHFNLDNVGAVGDLAPDGEIDNGWQILNVQNPLNARDHARQGVADLIHLLRTAPSFDFDDDPEGDVDHDRLHFVSISLGSILTTALLGVNDDFGSATLSSPGGPLSDFLFDPNAVDFGLPLRAAIEARGLPFGSQAYDNFARDLQTVLDPVDPVNYAAAATAAHPVHVIEVLGDQTITPALTDNLARLMSLDEVSDDSFDAAGVRGIVRFNAGGHSSLFNPAIDLAVTQEMQAQTVGFAATSGTAILVENADLIE